MLFFSHIRMGRTWSSINYWPGIFLVMLNICDFTLAQSYLGWRAEDFPDPQKMDDTRCDDIIRGRPSYVCDPDRVLTDYERFSLGEEAYDIRTSPDCDCGGCGTESFQVFLAIVPKIANTMGFSLVQNEVSQQTIDFADYLIETTYGEYTSCGEIVVIFVSRDDRQVHVNVGQGAQRILPSGCADVIFNEASWDYSDYYPGLLYLLQQYHNVAEGKRNCDQYRTEEPEKPSSGSGIWNSIGTFMGCVFIFVVVFGFCYLCICYSRQAEIRERISTFFKSSNGQESSQVEMSAVSTGTVQVQV